MISLRDCRKSEDLKNLYVSVILSAAKNPLCYQGDPSNASLLRMTCILMISNSVTVFFAEMTPEDRL